MIWLVLIVSLIIRSIDLLFGWLFKNRFELTGLEEIIGAIELTIAIFIILGIIQLIIFIIMKIKGE